MIQLADRFDRVFHGLVVAQPLLHVGHLFAVDAQLPGAAAGIADGEHGLRMPVAPGALGAAAGMARDAFDEGSAQDVASGGGEAFEQPCPRAECLAMCHLYR